MRCARHSDCDNERLGPAALDEDRHGGVDYPNLLKDGSLVGESRPGIALSILEEAGNRVTVPSRRRPGWLRLPLVSGRFHSLPVG